MLGRSFTHGDTTPIYGDDAEINDAMKEAQRARHGLHRAAHGMVPPHAGIDFDPLRFPGTRLADAAGGLNAVPGVTCRTPGGAFYAWPNVTEACKLTGCADSEELRKRLLNEAGVAVLADIHFGRRVPGDGQHIRLSYAAWIEAIRSGVERMDTFVRSHRR